MMVIWSYIAVLLFWIALYMVVMFVKAWRARPPFDRTQTWTDDEFPI